VGRKRLDYNCPTLKGKSSVEKHDDKGAKRRNSALGREKKQGGVTAKLAFVSPSGYFMTGIDGKELVKGSPKSESVFRPFRAVQICKPKGRKPRGRVPGNRKKVKKN